MFGKDIFAELQNITLFSVTLTSWRAEGLHLPLPSVQLRRLPFQLLLPPQKLRSCSWRLLQAQSRRNPSTRQETFWVLLLLLVFFCCYSCRLDLNFLFTNVAFCSTEMPPEKFQPKEVWEFCSMKCIEVAQWCWGLFGFLTLETCGKTTEKQNMQFLLLLYLRMRLWVGWRLLWGPHDGRLCGGPGACTPGSHTCRALHRNQKRKQPFKFFFCEIATISHCPTVR